MYCKTCPLSGVAIVTSVKLSKTVGIVGVPERELDQYVGKQVAEKILKQQSPEKFAGTISGTDLKIGGEWAKNLYDRQIPNILKDLTKGEVGSVEIQKPVYASKDLEPSGGIDDELVHYWSFNGNLTCDEAGKEDLYDQFNAFLVEDPYGKNNSALQLNNGYIKVYIKILLLIKIGIKKSNKLISNV